MNRTKNRKFISNRIKISPEQINNILTTIKNTKNWTWARLAQEFDVSEHTARFEWRLAKTTIPEPIMKKLEKLSKIKTEYQILSPWWGQKTGKSKFEDLYKIPIYSEELAEFYGAMLGDGCVFSTNQSFCITCNSVLDKEYMEYLKEKCTNLFGIEPKIYYAKNEKAVRLILNCKKITEFLMTLGFQSGKKKIKPPKIPEIFLTDPIFKTALLRGLIDTDGGIYAHPHTKMMLEFTSVIPELLETVFKIFKETGIEPNRSKYRVQFYGEKKVKKYFQKIGSSNPRNIIKYKQFIETGTIPNIKETERLLKRSCKEPIIPYYGPVV